MDPISKLIASLFTTLYAILSLVPRLMFQTIRLRKQHASFLYRQVKEGRHFILTEEACDKDDIPRIFSAIAWIGVPVYFNVQERMLRAGFQGTDWISTVTIPRICRRWLTRKFEEITLEEKPLSRVYLLQPWESEEIGSLNHEQVLATDLYVDDSVRKRVLSLAEQIFMNDTDAKAGMILHGEPGNGKTWIVRHLACKYRVPVYIALFNADMDNFALIRMFSKVRGPAIVLMEDFDSYYDKQQCLIKEAKFTFDIILNVLDGVFASPKRILFILTANEIDKVSDKLKKRRSRFNEVIEISNPNASVRWQILQDGKLTDQTDGASLDEVLHLHEAKSRLREKRAASVSLMVPSKNDEPSVVKADKKE